ncbi:MAG: hypothetical protein QM756_12325 [Polyangiaceae bacterium]
MTAHAALAPLLGALEPLLDAVADRVVRKLTEGQQADMVDQTHSPLGRRRHCNAVRRRVAAGEAGAAVVGRRHLLTREALGAELAALSGVRKRKPAAAPAAADDLASLREKYGLESAPCVRRAGAK